MWRLLITLVLALPMLLPWTPTETASDRETLQVALILAGLNHADLPITLASVTPASASPGAEAWTSYDATGIGKQIFVYTGSDIFRCASRPLRMRQCVIRLASVLVHEAWHFEHGRSEEEAYEAQIAFLLRNGAATEHVAAVRLAQNHVVSAARRASAAAVKPSGSSADARPD
jgi:hypothetical protein